jgi:hypothetical protein
MRDLRTEELGHVYGAGGRSSCAPKKNKCKGGSGSRGKGSGSRGKGSRGKGSRSKGRGRC